MQQKNRYPSIVWFRPVSIQFRPKGQFEYYDLKGTFSIYGRSYKHRTLYFKDENTALDFLYSEYPDIYDELSWKFYEHSGMPLYDVGNGSFIRVPQKEVVKKYV